MEPFLFIKNGAVTNQRIIPISIIVLCVSGSITPEKTRIAGSTVANNPINPRVHNSIFIFDRPFSE
jgi:hypothetical protein